MTKDQVVEFINYLSEMERNLFFEAKYNNDSTVRKVYSVALDVLKDIQCTFEEIVSR